MLSPILYSFALLSLYCCGRSIGNLNSTFCASVDNFCERVNPNNTIPRSPNVMNDAMFDYHRCFCDDDCWRYNDCCNDAKFSHRIIRDNNNSVKMFCHKFTDNSTSVYVVKTCPSKWTNNTIRSLCERKIENRKYFPILDLPFYSKATMNLYLNIYCAKCNDDHLNATVLKLNLKCAVQENCSVDLMNSSYVAGQLRWLLPDDVEVIAEVADAELKRFRKCRVVEDECASNWTDVLLRHLCYNSSTAYIENREGKAYKNIYCAQCNDEDVEKLDCREIERTLFDQGFRYHPETTAQQFIWILDFDLSPGQRCSNIAEFYDDFLHKCLSLSCSLGYELIDGRCVLKKKEPNINTGNFTMFSCTRVKIPIDELLVFANGSVYWDRTQTLYGENETDLIDNSSSYLLCVDDDELGRQSLRVRQFSSEHSILAIICMSISVICLLVHIVIQFLTDQLRKLPGKCVLNLSLALFIAQLLFLIGVKRTENQRLCFFIAILTHFFFLAVFFWMNILAIDVCRTFTRPFRRSSWKSKTFFYYCAYAWLFPVIIIITAVTIDCIASTSNFRPRYGEDICWISDRYALFIFFALPLAILLMENIILFSITACSIRNTVKINDSLKKSAEYKRYHVYLKLGIVVGIPWIIGFAAVFTAFEPLWYGFTIINASQGTFIFVIFSLKRNVICLLREKLFDKSSPKTGSSKRTEFVSLNQN